MSPAKATLQACRRNLFSSRGQVHNAHISASAHPESNAGVPHRRGALCLLLDLCGARRERSEERLLSLSQQNATFHLTKVLLRSKTSPAGAHVVEHLYGEGGGGGCAVSPLFSVNEQIELRIACGSVELYQWRPAVPLHLPNFTEPRASSGRAAYWQNRGQKNTNMENIEY